MLCLVLRLQCFYLWKDEATFRGFTRPLHKNTLGFVYGSYYCWVMKRSACSSRVACRSPCALPEDLKRQFPSCVDSDSTHELVTLEELSVIDKLRRALRVVEQLLQGKQYLGGYKASVLDALVFAHLAILFSLPLPGMFCPFRMARSAVSPQRSPWSLHVLCVWLAVCALYYFHSVEG